MPNATLNGFELEHGAADCCRYNGARIGSLPGELAMCQEQCAARQTCLYFSWSERWQRCHLCAACTLNTFGSKATYASYRRREARSMQCRGRGSVTPFVPAREPIRLAVSLPVYGAAPWVEFLVRNTLAFIQPSSGLMLHLNAQTIYSPCTVERWNQSVPRLAVNPVRIPVRRATGLILYAHLSNAKAISWRWPQCEYMVLMASNAFWVRPGMEARVLALRHSATEIRNLYRFTYAGVKSIRRDPVYAALVAPKGIYSYMWHEGTFYPIQLVLQFAAYLEAWERNSSGTELGASSRLLTRPNLPAEEYYLNAFALNHAGYTPQPWHGAQEAQGTQLCWRVGSQTMQNHFVTMDRAARVCAGKEDAAYFAVKRVERVLDRPLSELLALWTLRQTQGGAPVGCASNGVTREARSAVTAFVDELVQASAG